MGRRINIEEIIALLLIACFSLGCMTTAHRSPKAVEQGKIAIGMGFTRLTSTDSDGGDPAHLINVDSRYGLGKGVDIGLSHSFDITENNEQRYSTVWGDVRWQLTNPEAIRGKPMLGIGWGTGYIYHEDAEFWVVSYPVSIGVPLERMTPYIGYRLEYINDKFRFIPESDEEPRNLFYAGVELPLQKVDVSPAKLILEVGTVNSVYGGKGDNGLMINVGVNYDF